MRVPEQTIGDMMANVACTRSAGAMLTEFMDEYGLADLTLLADAIRDQSERAMREELARIPQGVYRNRGRVEGFDVAPLRLRVTHRRDGDRSTSTSRAPATRARRDQRAVLLHARDGAACDQVA